MIRVEIQEPITNATVTSFDRAARMYCAHAKVQSAMADWLAEWLPTERSGRAVGIGAGPGVVTKKLLPWKGRVLATDISPAMCAVGCEAVPQVNWRVMPAEAPNDGPWDWIFSNSMLQWVVDPEQVLVAWRKCLAGNGR